MIFSTFFFVATLATSAHADETGSAAHPCSLFRLGEGNATMDGELGFHGEQCFNTGVPGEVRLNNRDVSIGNGQDPVKGGFSVRNTAYAIVSAGTVLRQWARYPTSAPPDIALYEWPEDGGTPNYPFDDFLSVNVGTAVNAPADILARIGAHKVTTKSGVEVVAAPLLRPLSVDKITGADGVELLVYKFERQGDSEIFVAKSWRMIKVRSGLEVPMSLLEGWIKIPSSH